MSRIVLWSLIGGVVLVLLKVLEYQHFVHAYPTEIYGGLVALIFTGLGLFFGSRWARGRQRVVVHRQPPTPTEPFAPAGETLRELAITPREHEILGLIAEGLSNREIGQRIFVSENTVKTHASRLFDKLSVSRRVQAVRRGRELRLIP